MEDPIYITGLLFLGLGIKLVGFAIRDELLLRVLVAIGITCDVLFYTLRSEPVWNAVAANASLVTINVVLILLIVTERTSWRMSPEDRSLFKHFPTLTPGQFRRIRKLMVRETLDPETPLTLEGKPVEDLMLVFSDQVMITKNGESFPIAGPTFVGEISFLTGHPSSADVHLPDGGTVVRLPVAELRRLMRKSPGLHNAVVALFGQEMARKVADSVPMDRAADTRSPEAASDGAGLAVPAGAAAGAMEVVGSVRSTREP